MWQYSTGWPVVCGNLPVDDPQTVGTDVLTSLAGWPPAAYTKDGVATSHGGGCYRRTRMVDGPRANVRIHSRLYALPAAERAPRSVLQGAAPERQLSKDRGTIAPTQLLVISTAMLAGDALLGPPGHNILPV